MMLANGHAAMWAKPLFRDSHKLLVRASLLAVAATHIGELVGNPGYELVAN